MNFLFLIFHYLFTFYEVKVSLLINFITKKTPTQMFSFEFYETFNDTFFIKHLWWLLLKTESRFSDSMHKSSNWELFWKKTCSEACFSWEFEVFWIVQLQLRIDLLSLREKFPNTEFFLVRIFLHSDWIRVNFRI